MFNNIDDEELKILLKPYCNYIFEYSLYDKDSLIDDKKDCLFEYEDELYIYIQLHFYIKGNVSTFINFYRDILSYKHREITKNYIHHFNIRRTMSKFHVNVTLIFKECND